jgi:hypothetical protein
MATPQQFLESFFREKAAVYAEANIRLSPMYATYFGEPLSKHARDFMLIDPAEVTFDNIEQSVALATVIARQHVKSRYIRTRYRLAAAGESWKIVGIDHECFLCRGTGRSGDSRCRECGGEGWYERKRNAD